MQRLSYMVEILFLVSAQGPILQALRKKLHGNIKDLKISFLVVKTACDTSISKKKLWSLKSRLFLSCVISNIKEERNKMSCLAGFDFYRTRNNSKQFPVFKEHDTVFSKVKWWKTQPSYQACRRLKYLHCRIMINHVYFRIHRKRLT